MKLEQRTFQTEYPVFAFRSFTAHGRKFERGQDFPWKDLGIAKEKVDVMYKTGLIRHRPIVDQPKPVEVKKVDPVHDDTLDLDAMNKDELEAFAKANFGVNLDKRKKVETLRDDVLDLLTGDGK